MPHEPLRSPAADDAFRFGEELFPFLADLGVAVSACRLDAGWDDPERLHPAERSMLSGAAPVRRREIIAGRTQARALIERLGREAAPIPRAADRRPLWPAGLIGSITHSREFCAVALAPNGVGASLGIDLEPLDPIEPELHATICAGEELRALAAPGWPFAPPELVCCAFAAKEAFYKAWYPVTGRFLEHHDVVVTLAQDLCGFSATLRSPDGAAARGRPVAGQMRLAKGHVAAALILDAGWSAAAG